MKRIPRSKQRKPKKRRAKKRTPLQLLGAAIMACALNNSKESPGKGR